ncbi:MAG TPA: glycosyltransferase WbuB, partial [Streptosporangiaceae bacterium]
MTTSGMHPSPRALTLAASIGWRHAAADPVRALLLAWRVLPAPLRGWLRLAGPYGRAAVLWGAGERDAALASLAGSPRRLAAFALAADQPAAAAAAVDRLPGDDKARPVLGARLAWREGRLTDALRALDSAPGRHTRRLRTTLTAEQTLVLAAKPPAQSMIVSSFGQIAPISAHDHETGSGTRLPQATPPVPGCVLHLVTDALPTTSAGYTIRTHEIALAQREAGLDPHVATRAGYPMTQGRIDGR